MANIAKAIKDDIEMITRFGMKKIKLKKWAIEFPDGSIPGQYFYDKKKDLKQFSPSAIYGDCSTWRRAFNDGYKIIRV